jgi:5-methylcytosine-specific restriction endonuclease McrA
MTGKARIPRHLRDRVAQAASYCCGYCRTPERITGYRMTVDHIVPEARGGKTIEDNLWLACVAYSTPAGSGGMRTSAGARMAPGSSG